MGLRPSRAALPTVAVVACMLPAGCGNAGPSAPSGSIPAPPTSFASSVFATQTQPVSSTLAAQPPPSQTTSPLEDWCNGVGYSDYQTVASDIQQVSVDLGNGQYGTATQDGTALFRDATAAAANLPPVSKHRKLDYGLFMGWLLEAGYKLSIGDTTAANYDAGQANQFQTVIQNITGQCAALGA